MGTIEYMNYHAFIDYDPEIEKFIGRVMNARDIITFYGSSVDELKREFEVSIKDYLKLCAERGIEPERPYSGKFNVRIEPTLHRNLAIAAAMKGVSLNAFVEQTLEKEASNLAA